MDFIENNMTIIYGGLGLIVLLLSIYLGYLLQELRKQKKKVEEAEKFLSQKNQERHEFRVSSLETIALATLQEQCEISEACIRIKKLLEYYPDVADQKSLVIIQEMYNEIKSFDTLEARNALSKQEKFKQDTQRFKIEEQYRESFLEALKELQKSIKSLKGTSYSTGH